MTPATLTHNQKIEQGGGGGGGVGGRQFSSSSSFSSLWLFT